MLKINRSSKIDVDQKYTESRNLVTKKDKYSNVCLKNFVKVVEDSYTKKDLIPLMLIEIMDRENKIRMTLDEMSEVLDYPKTSLSTLFAKFKKRDFIQRVRNGEYMINPAISFKGSKPDRDKLMEEYNSLSKKKYKKEEGI